MTWRTVHVSSDIRINCENRQLKASYADGASNTVPIEDIAALVLESHQCSITVAAIAELLEVSIAILLDLKDDKIANNNHSFIMSQFNSGSVAIAITPSELNEIYNQVQKKAKTTK